MAEKELGKLLKGMHPTAVSGKYYFASVPEARMMTLANYIQYITCIFREKEGLSVVFTEELAGIVESLAAEKIAGPFALITLSVESDLAAVGFLARITDALAKEKIAVNAVSAYWHDHLFVPYGKKDAALGVLAKLQKSGRAT